MFSKNAFTTLFFIALISLVQAAPLAAPACPAPVTVTVTARSTAQTPVANNVNSNNNAKNNASGGSGFGSCSAPEIVFSNNVFSAKDTKAFSGCPSDKNIHTVAKFMCNKLSTSCNASKSARDTCNSAMNSGPSTKGTGKDADNFNGKFGQKTTFGNTSSSNNNGGKGTTNAVNPNNSGKPSSSSSSSNNANNNTPAFGKCSAPQIQFKNSKFSAVDTKAFAGCPTDQNIHTVAQFMCSKLSSSCSSNKAAQNLCNSAMNSVSSNRGNGGDADKFNGMFGKKTNFGSSSSNSNSGNNGNNNNNNNNNNKPSFGSCSAPQIKFANNKFTAVDTKAFSGCPTDKNIKNVAKFMCGKLSSSCGGNKQAQDLCTSALNSCTANGGSGADADKFNVVFGTKTSFGTTTSNNNGNNNNNNANNNANNNVNNSTNNNAGGGAGAGQNNLVNNNNDSGASSNSTNNDNGDPQTSLTLISSVIATGFAQDGQAQPTAGQVASLTSTNNFINFCAQFPNLPITNGLQIKTGSCNPAPMGEIPSVDKMPSSKFQNPPNFGTIKSNTAFDIKMAIKNIITGNFVNPQTNYYAAPQQLNPDGTIIGHSHFVIEKITSLSQTDPTDPTTFAFFKGVNTPAQGGILTVNCPGLPAGDYRLASINAAMNHQPVLAPVAQHGTLDDMVYFTVTDDGAPAAGSNNAVVNNAAAGNGAQGNGNGKNATQANATPPPAANNNNNGTQQGTGATDKTGDASTKNGNQQNANNNSTNGQNNGQQNANGNNKGTGQQTPPATTDNKNGQQTPASTDNKNGGQQGANNGKQTPPATTDNKSGQQTPPASNDNKNGGQQGADNGKQTPASSTKNGQQSSGTPANSSSDNKSGNGQQQDGKKDDSKSSSGSGGSAGSNNKNGQKPY